MKRLKRTGLKDILRDLDVRKKDHETEIYERWNKQWDEFANTSQYKDDEFKKLLDEDKQEYKEYKKLNEKVYREKVGKELTKYINNNPGLNEIQKFLLLDKIIKKFKQLEDKDNHDKKRDLYAYYDYKNVYDVDDDLHNLFSSKKRKIRHRKPSRSKKSKSKKSRSKRL